MGALWRGGLTIAGPRTLRISPEAVLSAVSPPTMPVQSESITTQTNGKLSWCHAKADTLSSMAFCSAAPAGPPLLTEMLMFAISKSNEGTRSMPATLEMLETSSGEFQAAYVKGARL